LKLGYDPPVRVTVSSRLSRLASALFSVSAVLSAVPLASASDAQWIEIQSPHFSVVTDAGEKRGRETAMRFEQMRSVFGTLLTKVNVNLPIPLQIVAFRNSKEFRQFAPLWHGKPVELAGLFQSGEDRSFIMLDMSVENPWTVVFHEYAHQLMNGVLTARVDPWFEEGFAEYFSSIEVDNREARVGKIPEYDYQILQQNGMMKIADLFRVQQNSSTYNETGSHRTVFYAESGMLVHYLYDNDLVIRLSNYFGFKIDRNVPVEDAIKQAFGFSPDQFDKVLRNYVSDGRFRYYPIPTPPNIVSKDYVAKPLSSADSSAVMADIHLHSLDYHDKAIAEFQEILKTQPNHAAACRGLGYAYLQKRDFEQAGEYFKRAAQADSKDPRVHYYSALMLSRDGSFANRSDLPQMTSELETAIALDPGFADSYMLLAFAQSYGGDPAKGLASAQKAVSLSPRNESYQFDLAQMYLNNQKLDDALTILQALQKSSNPEVTQRAAQLLAQAQQYQTAMRSNQATRPAGKGIDYGASRSSSQIGKVSTTGEATQPMAPQVPVRFLKGTILSVDCSSPPAAMLTVVSGSKTWKMQVADSKHALVIGADELLCSWNKQKVAVNYRETGEAAGSVVSIEVQ
jgi:tetratricopeptide (TPR) repeat protein